MVASQNGWRANDPSVISSLNVPGTQVSIRVRKDAPGLLLLQIASAFDRLVEDIDNARGALDDWGYAERPIRGGSDLSNHASGTAIDLNATRHPLGRVGTFSPQQVAKIHQIISTTGGTVRWGGDYTGRKDEMHFEINDGRTMEQCQNALIAMQQFNKTGGTPAKPAPVNTSTPATADRASVMKLQGFLNRYYRLNLVVDGIYGPLTTEAVKRFQRNYGHGLAVDGIAGPQTRKAMGI